MSKRIVSEISTENIISVPRKKAKIVDFKNCIFIRRNFSGDWSVYFDLINEPFYNLQDAIKYFREHNKEKEYFELREYNQIENNGGGWDNC